MNNFYFSHCNTVTPGDVVNYPCNCFQLRFTVNSLVVFNLFFNQGFDLIVIRQLFFAQTLFEALCNQLNHIIIIPQIFEIALSGFKAGGRNAVDDGIIQT